MAISAGIELCNNKIERVQKYQKVCIVEQKQVKTAMVLKTENLLNIRKKCRSPFLFLVADLVDKNLPNQGKHLSARHSPS